MITFYDDIIRLIRSEVSEFGNRVGGTPEFEALRQTSASLGTPYCFVVPIGRDATNIQGNRASQDFVLRFATIICVDNKLRKLQGQNLQPITQVQYLISRLVEVLSGMLSTEPRAGRISFTSDFHLEMLEHRLWHQVEWSVPGILNGTPAKSSISSSNLETYNISDLFTQGEAVDCEFIANNKGPETPHEDVTEEMHANYIKDLNIYNDSHGLGDGDDSN